MPSGGLLRTLVRIQSRGVGIPALRVELARLRMVLRAQVCVDWIPNMDSEANGAILVYRQPPVIPAIPQPDENVRVRAAGVLRDRHIGYRTKSK